MPPLLVVRDERFKRHLDQVPHLESARRMTAINSALEHPSLEGRWLEAAPRLASPEELALVHTPEHIARVAASAGQALTSFDLDTQASPLSYEVARLAAGAVFSLLDGIMANQACRGIALVRPPGHHAEPDRPMGFCLFNNVALGANYLRRKYGLRRIMIVDIDAHHGNGTQAAFWDSDEVLFVSFHQFPAFPGTGNAGEVGRGKGEGFTVNVPLSRGLGDRDLARTIYFLLNPLGREFQPEIILVSCGFDLYWHDPLTQMKVTPEGYALITSFLLDMAERFCGGRLAFVLEGGYSLKGIRECGLRVLQELCGLTAFSTKDKDRIRWADASKLDLLKKVSRIHKKYWTIL